MSSQTPRFVALVLCVTVVAAGCAASSPPNSAIPPVVSSQLIAELVGERPDGGGGGTDGGVMTFAWSDGRWVHAELSYVDQDVDAFVNPPSDADLSMGDTREVAVEGDDPLVRAERPPLLVDQTVDCIRVMVASWHFDPLGEQAENRFLRDVRAELASWRTGLAADPCEERLEPAEEGYAG